MSGPAEFRSLSLAGSGIISAMPPVAGRARAVPYVRGAFLIPAAALAASSSVVSDAALSTGVRLLVVSAIGFAAGTVWQLIYRRDLVDRLTYFASAFIVWAVFLCGLSGHDQWQPSPGMGVCMAAILAGCVYCERWHRWRSTRITSAARRRRLDKPRPA